MMIYTYVALTWHVAERLSTQAINIFRNSKKSVIMFN